MVDDTNRAAITTEDNESLKVRWAILNSDKRLLAPAIDGGVTIHKRGEASVCAEYHRDSYPALEIYQYRSGATYEVLYQDAAHNADRGLFPFPWTDKHGSICN